MSWIKIRVNLWTHPKVVTLASRLAVTKAHAVGALCALWCVTDQHADDSGTLNMSADAMDAEVGVPGFCSAVEAIGWLTIGNGLLQVPRYTEHNGPTAKVRAGGQKRAQASRSRNGRVTVERDDTVTREEKRREEKSNTPPSPSRFIKPTVEEVRAYCVERKNSVSPEGFIDHYAANGWRVGKSPMRDWRAAVRTWERNEFPNGKAEPARYPGR